MNENEEYAQGKSIGSSQAHNAFAEFEIQDYVENPVLISVLRVQAGNAQATIARLTKSERLLKRDLDQVKQKLSDELVDHEKTRGRSEATTARLQEKISSLQDQVRELRRLSAVAVTIAWVGTALVAIGINLLTGGNNKVLGLAIVIAGAGVEVAAFFVRRHTRTSKELH